MADNQDLMDTDDISANSSLINHNVNDPYSQDNLGSIALQIFNKPPGRPNSICLELDDYTLTFSEPDGIDQFIFNVLCVLTMRGIEILYGHKNILHLSYPEYLHINDYTRSYGYNFHVFANDTQVTPWEIHHLHQPLYRYTVSFSKTYDI